MESFHWLSAAFFVSILVLAIIHGQKEFDRAEKLRQQGTRVQAIVIRNKFYLGKNSHFRPIIQFSTKDGELIEMEDTSGIALAFPKFAEGANVIVSYDEQNPRNFTVLTPGRYS